MLSMKYCTFFLLGMILICGVGCSKNLQLKGKVTFSDDGSPLDAGMILFENGPTVSRGTINKDGTFTMGSEKQTDGLPPGTYSVYFANAVKAEGDMRAPRMVYLLDPKYNSAATSGITVTVDRSTKSPLEIQVERFSTGK